SNDNALLLTASSEQLKLWNCVKGACVRTLDSGYALCSAFVPGGRHVVIGTKNGEIELWKLASGECLERILAHEGPVWSIDVRVDQRGFATGGGDKQVKCWDFELVDASTAEDNTTVTAKRLSIVHTSTLTLTDDVLSLKHSPDGKYIA